LKAAEDDEKSIMPPRMPQHAVHVALDARHASHVDAIEGRKRIMADRDARGTHRAMQQPRQCLVPDKDTHDVTSFQVNVSGLQARVVVAHRLIFKSRHDSRDQCSNRQLDGDFRTMEPALFHLLLLA